MLSKSADVFARLAGLLACAALLAGCSLFGPRPADRPARSVVPHIAYVGADDHIYIAEADGSAARQITQRMTGLSTDQGWTFRWPTYSPDGRRLAFVGYRAGSGGLASSAVLVADATQSSSSSMLESTELSPIYLYWSPDNRRLTALFQEGQDLKLYVLDASGQDAPRQILVGQPLYWSWAPDGNDLAVHVGGDGQANPDAWVGLLHMSEGGVREEHFSEAPGGFRAPAWAPTGGKVAYVAMGGGVSLLSVRDAAGQIARVASSTGVGEMAFSWSPAGDWLAFASPSASSPGVYDGLELARADGKERHRLTQDPVVGFYWAPDSKRLAVVGLDTGARQLTWSTIQADAKGRRALGSFLPSGDFAFQLPFFDQYSQSTSLWSPDGRKLTYASDGGGTRRNGSSTGERVMVIDVDGQAEAAAVTPGGLAVWSPAGEN
jgi:Tol biopolymer transport system component